MLQIIVHPEAEDEIREAADYLDDRRPGHGRELVREIRFAYRTISGEPRRWNFQDYGYRRYTIQRFGFLVWYRETQKEVFVIAVHHGSREPGYWKNRKFLDEQR